MASTTALRFAALFEPDALRSSLKASRISRGQTGHEMRCVTILEEPVLENDWLQHTQVTVTCCAFLELTCFTL